MYVGRAEYLKQDDIRKGKLLEGDMMPRLIEADAYDGLSEKGALVTGSPGCGKTFFVLKELLKRGKKFDFYFLDKETFEYRRKIGNRNPEVVVIDDPHYVSYGIVTGMIDEDVAAKRLTEILSSTDLPKILITAEFPSDTVLRFKKDENRRKIIAVLQDFFNDDDTKMLREYGASQCGGVPVIALDSLVTRKEVNLEQSKIALSELRSIFGSVEDTAREIMKMNVPYFAITNVSQYHRNRTMVGPLASPRALTTLAEVDKREIVKEAIENHPRQKGKLSMLMKHFYDLFDSTAPEEWPGLTLGAFDYVLRWGPSHPVSNAKRSMDSGYFLMVLEFISNAVNKKYRVKAAKLGEGWGAMARSLLYAPVGKEQEIFVQHYMAEEM